MQSTFVRFQRFGRQVPGGAWWLVMAPGLLLIFMAVAILIWPELLAYMVASVILFFGVTITGWGWSLRRIEKRQSNQQLNQMSNERHAGDTVIYYER